MKFSKKMVMGVAIFLVIFSQEMVLLSFLGKPEPVVTAGAVFTAGLGEFGFLSWMRSVDKKRGGNDDNI